MRYASFGSISSGTMRLEDLIPTFASELNSLVRKQPRGVPRARYRAIIRAADRISNYESDEAHETLQKLVDALNDFAPDYGYFGSNEGDGADYGFWLSSDALADFLWLRVSDLSEVPQSYNGEILLTNDHGNVSLFHKSRRGLREIWSVV